MDNETEKTTEPGSSDDVMVVNVNSEMNDIDLTKQERQASRFADYRIDLDSTWSFLDCGNNRLLLKNIGHHFSMKKQKDRKIGYFKISCENLEPVCLRRVSLPVQKPGRILQRILN